MADSDSKRGKNELRKSFNKEKEYLKIQVLADYNLASANLGSGFVSSAFVAIIVVLLTLSFQGTLNLLTYYVALVVLVWFFIALFLWSGKKYRKDLNHISQLIEDVDSGKSLPQLKDMRDL